MSSVDSALKRVKRFIPRSIFSFAQPYYHGLMALIGAIMYGFPAKKLIVIGVTGTKGKSSVTEYINSIFEEAGYSTVMINTVRIKIGDESSPEKRHMTMPGRTFIQRTLSAAIKKGCEVAILEISSEGAKQWRDRFLSLDTLVFTNLAPEHIESHGSFENYANTKLSIAKRLENSGKRPRSIVANINDTYGEKFLQANVENRVGFSLKETEPYRVSSDSATFTLSGENIKINFPGEFSIMNALAAAKVANIFNINNDIIKKGLEKLEIIPGRVENISKNENFSVIVDYAHTPESLEALYKAYDSSRKICVLGAAGGGRDTWKRPKMGAVADKYCSQIILTNEDPYDENPEKIVEDVRSGINKSVEIIMDRREAIHRAIELAAPGDTILITGKGSNPAICEANGKMTPWSDSAVAKEELSAIKSVK